jgi:hypothetical protein
VSYGAQRKGGPTVFGQCRLCLQRAELNWSHLLPRALYRMVGSGTDRLHPDTVQLTLNSRRKSSEQIRRHLLCSGCEQTLNRGGEAWMLHNCYRGRGQFRFRADLRTRALLPGFDLEAYSAFEEEVSKLSFFALSVVWRASLCDWFCRGEKYEQLNLGPYQNEIRKYLRGDSGVPHRVGVMVVLSNLERPLLAMSLPFSYRIESYRCHRFHIPGVTFVLTAGGAVSANVKDRLSIVQSPNAILIGTVGDRRAQDEMTLLMRKVLPSGFQAPLMEGTERA